MANKRQFILECAASHEEHKDYKGAKAIRSLAYRGEAAALRQYPEHEADIINARDYANQEMAEARKKV